MARSNGRAAAIVALCALGYLTAQLAAFVGPSASGRNLRSRVSLAASPAEIDAAQKDFKLKQWAADQLSSQGSPLAAAAAERAQQAEAAYLALKDGEAPPAAPVAVAPAPVAAPVVAAAPAVSSSSMPSTEEVAAAEKEFRLKQWAANTLASQGSPLAAAAAGRAQQAEAAYAALKAQLDGQAPPAAAAPAPVAAAPVAAAPVAVAPAASSSAPSAEEVAQAKKAMDLHRWAADQLAKKGAPEAAAMQAKAEQSRLAYEALKEQVSVAR